MVVDAKVAVVEVADERIPVTQRVSAGLTEGTFGQPGATGFLDGDLVAVGDSAVDVLNQLLAKLDLEKVEVITIYYGADANSAETEQVGGSIRERYPQLQIEVVRGDQPHYNYIVSVE